MTEAYGRRWDARDYPAADRCDAWREVLNATFGAWTMERPIDRNFDARLVHHAIGAFQIVECVCDPCAARRAPPKITSGDRDQVTIQLVLSGREIFDIDDTRVTLDPGDVLIWNSIRPMRFEVVERLRKVSVTMPLERLRCWLPQKWRSTARGLPRISPGAHLLSSYIGAISPAFFAGALKNSDALTESMMGLLVNVLDGGGEDAAPPASGREAQLLRVKQYIAEHLSDPALSPAAIARAQRVSIRYLHALFEDQKTTLRQYVIEKRLQRCRRDLAAPAMAERSITDIAYGWGFQCPAHFSRRFKAAFGLSPRAFRVEAAANPRLIDAPLNGGT